MTRANTRAMQSVPATEAAYIAGILDGEGCFTFTRSKLKTGWNYTPRVHVTNTKLVLLEWLVEKTGLGNIHPLRRKNPKYAPTWVWFVTVGGVRQLVPVVMPYLVLKIRQAEILLECAALTTPGGRPPAPELIEAKRKLIAELKSLNRKGACDPENTASPHAAP